MVYARAIVIGSACNAIRSRIYFFHHAITIWPHFHIVGTQFCNFVIFFHGISKQFCKKIQLHLKFHRKRFATRISPARWKLMCFFNKQCIEADCFFASSFFFSRFNEHFFQCIVTIKCIHTHTYTNNWNWPSWSRLIFRNWLNIFLWHAVTILFIKKVWEGGLI